MEAGQLTHVTFFIPGHLIPGQLMMHHFIPVQLIPGHLIPSHNSSFMRLGSITFVNEKTVFKLFQQIYNNFKEMNPNHIDFAQSG